MAKFISDIGFYELSLSAVHLVLWCQNYLVLLDFCAKHLNSIDYHFTNYTCKLRACFEATEDKCCLVVYGFSS